MRADEHRLVERALDSLDDVFYVYDSGGRLVYWNDALRNVFGFSEEDLGGMRPTEFFVASDRPNIERAFDAAIEHGSAVVEARAETVDGPILFELTGQRLVDGDGSVVGVSGIGRDVTESREREWQIERQNERLAEFADVLTHDLRNPLQVAISYLEIERATADSERLGAVADALDRIGRIIDDVLLVAREGQAVIEREPVELAEVAENAWAQVATDGGTLVVETTRFVTGDQARLGRLFENVYRNAMEHGGSGVEVTVTDTDTGFAIEDDGQGYPEKGRDELFDPGVSSSTEGTGFGLNIVRTLTEAHGWTVRAEDASGGGARLAFDLDTVTSGAAGLDRRDGGRATDTDGSAGVGE